MPGNLARLNFICFGFGLLRFAIGIFEIAADQLVDEIADVTRFEARLDRLDEDRPIEDELCRACMASLTWPMIQAVLAGPVGVLP